MPDINLPGSALPPEIVCGRARRDPHARRRNLVESCIEACKCVCASSDVCACARACVHVRMSADVGTFLFSVWVRSNMDLACCAFSRSPSSGAN